MSVKNGKVYTYRVVYRCGHAYTIETRRRVSKTEQTHDQDVASRTLCPRCEEREEKNVRGEK
jgi:ribosomal protein L37AE/L43A